MLLVRVESPLWARLGREERSGLRAEFVSHFTANGTWQAPWSWSRAPSSRSRPANRAGGFICNPTASTRSSSRSEGTEIMTVMMTQAYKYGPARFWLQSPSLSQSDWQGFSSTSVPSRHREPPPSLPALPRPQFPRATMTADPFLERSNRPRWFHSLGNVAATSAPSSTPRLIAVRSRSWTRRLLPATTLLLARRRDTAKKMNAPFSRVHRVARSSSAMAVRQASLSCCQPNYFSYISDGHH